MVQLDAEYPGYGIAQHKGYGTAAHLAALERLGPTPLHRFSFAPIRDLQRRHQVDAQPVCDRAESQESYATR
jgi:ribonuclease HII